MGRVRPAVAEDRAALVAIAEAVDETGPVSAADPRYVAHVGGRGRFLVAVDDRDVAVAYGGSLERRGARYLTDLFVAPEHRGAGHGGALLRELWAGSCDQVTSSSQDPRALASYTRWGARPRWPMLYLHLPGSDAPPADAEQPAGLADATGWDYPHAGARIVRAGTAVAVVDPEAEGVVVRRATTPDPGGLVELLRRVSGLAGPDGRVRVVVPGPHPALPAVLDLGAQVRDVDLWCASDGAAERWDPAHELPHPGLG